MAKLKIVVATFNQDKIREIEDFFDGWPLEFLALNSYTSQVPKEDGDSFEANARIKAEYGYAVCGLPSLADDSGLEVDALGGAPGILSSRYAGPDADYAANNQKLLRELANVPLADRTARFRCVMVLLGIDYEPLVCQGVCQGHIALEPAGSGGFGYDPLFVPRGSELTLAQYTLEDKNSISHRARALASLASELGNRGLLE